MTFSPCDYCNAFEHFPVDRHGNSLACDNCSYARLGMIIEDNNKKVYALFLRHCWDSYDGERYHDYFSGVFLTHSLASKHGAELVKREPDFYSRYYVSEISLNKVV